MRYLLVTVAALMIAGCASIREEQRDEDPRGIVMDYQSASDRGGVGNYLFREDYENSMSASREAETAESEEEKYWETVQSSPTWQPSAELVGENIEISDEIRFKFGSAELTDDAKLILDDVAAVIKNNEDKISSVQVAGHTDEVGSRGRNQSLSEQRAESVRKYLISQGISDQKLSAVGYGEQRPKYDPLNSSPEEISQNRRVEFRTEMTTLAE